jgi:LAS superfamily LD-carboxypeptidase LdcB/cbb3-type cytochrome oxidase subunit 3
MTTEQTWRRRVYAVSAITLVLTGLLLGLSYYAYTQHDRILMLLEERNYFLLEHASSTKQLEVTLATASSTIATITLERDDILAKLEQEKDKNDDFEQQINKIAGTVGKLDKLSKTDEELLQKYSKVYFLNENYTPSRLSLIDKAYMAPGRDEQYFHSSALPFLTKMITAAKADDIDLTVVSAYRSFETQADLKGAYLQSYGSGANTFSADQGYSEHQLGTTLDLSTKSLGGDIDSFGESAAFAWMEKNAHKYGFVMSYPKDNAYYVYEPWHWRFVGEDLAEDLYDDEAHFYDWDQRKIDEYLIKVFD